MWKFRQHMLLTHTCLCPMGQEGCAAREAGPEGLCGSRLGPGAAKVPGGGVAEHAQEVVSLNEFQIVVWLFIVCLFHLKSKPTEKRT